MFAAELSSIESLPDALLLLILDRVAEVKTLGRCAAVSRRLRSLLCHVHNVVVKVDCITSDVNATPSPSKSGGSGALAHLSRLVRRCIFRPIQTLLAARRTNLMVHNRSDHGSNATHHSPTQVLRDFAEIKFLRIDLPSPELQLENGFLLNWRATFGSTLYNCVILVASLCSSEETAIPEDMGDDGVGGVMPESFYVNRDLRSRLVWMISSLMVASARRYLIQSIIDEHQTLERLVVSDSSGQGVLSMDRAQLEEARMKKTPIACSEKRTVVPDLELRFWYAPRVELVDGSVLMGVMLGAIRPREETASKGKFLEGDWVSGAFEEPYASAVKVLTKGRTYSIDMNSF